VAKKEVLGLKWKYCDSGPIHEPEIEDGNTGRMRCIEGLENMSEGHLINKEQVG